MSEEFDYIVVGAGSAGCVLAARLSEDPSTRVLLLEAGPPDRSIWIHLPIGYGKTMWDATYNWCYHTDPDPNMNDRRIYWPRGKTLGGSSSINGLIYIRGQREDYEHWAALGNAGWGYDDVLPYFVRAEYNQRGASTFHGGSGPLRVSDIGEKHELIEAFIDGAAECGVPRTDVLPRKGQVTTNSPLGRAGGGVPPKAISRPCASAATCGWKPMHMRPALFSRVYARWE
jgi:choline dehydrogenase